MRIVLFLISVFSTASAFRTCPSSCTTSFYHSLYSILGTRHVNALRAPFHEIMRTEEDAQTLYRKAKWTCFSVTRLDSCLKRCPSSFQKSAILSSLAHFNDYCALLRKPTRAVMNYFTCEREHLRKVQQNCEEVSVSYASNFNEICRILENYRKCYTTQKHNCTADALEIKERMDDSLMKTFETLLKMNANHFKIPSKCSVGLRRHRLRHFEYDDEEDNADYSESDDDGESTYNSPYEQNLNTLEMRSTESSKTLQSTEHTVPSDTKDPIIYSTTTITSFPDSNVKKKHSLTLEYRYDAEEMQESQKEETTYNEETHKLSPRPRWIGDVPSTASIETTTHQEIIIHREMSPISRLEHNSTFHHFCSLFSSFLALTLFLLF